MLDVEKKGRVCHLILNRPEKRNALDSALVDELQFHFDRAFDDDEIKLIVLSAKGEAFCSGADLAMLKEMQTASYEDNIDDSARFARLLMSIRNGKKVVLAAIQGHAIAGGCGLAGVCDISVASEKAKLGYTETRIGFVPAIVAKFLLEKIGETRTKKMLLSGRLITAKEAEQTGLISEAVPEKDFERHIEEWINTLLHKVSGEALSQTKYLINKVTDMTVAEAVGEAVQANAAARSTDDCIKGINAFLKKEKIKW